MNTASHFLVELCDMMAEKSCNIMPCCLFSCVASHTPNGNVFHHLDDALCCISRMQATGRTFAFRRHKQTWRRANVTKNGVNLDKRRTPTSQDNSRSSCLKERLPVTWMWCGYAMFDAGPDFSYTNHGELCHRLVPTTDSSTTDHLHENNVKQYRGSLHTRDTKVPLCAPNKSQTQMLWVALAMAQHVAKNHKD